MDATDARARHSNSVVLAPDAGTPYCINVPISDVQTAATRTTVQALNKQEGHLFSCTSR